MSERVNFKVRDDIVREKTSVLHNKVTDTRGEMIRTLGLGLLLSQTF